MFCRGSDQGEHMNIFWCNSLKNLSERLPDFMVVRIWWRTTEIIRIQGNSDKLKYRWTLNWEGLRFKCIFTRKTNCISLFFLLYLFFAVIILLLELPVDYSTLRFWTALKKSAAVLYSIDNLFLQSLTTWVICRTRKRKEKKN